MSAQMKLESLKYQASIYVPLVTFIRLEIKKKHEGGHVWIPLSSLSPLTSRMKRYGFSKMEDYVKAGAELGMIDISERSDGIWVSSKKSLGSMDPIIISDESDASLESEEEEEEEGEEGEEDEENCNDEMEDLKISPRIEEREPFSSGADFISL